MTPWNVLESLACLGARKSTSGAGLESRSHGQQVAKFPAFWGWRSTDQPRSGKPITYNAAFRNRVLALLEQSLRPACTGMGRP